MKVSLTMVPKLRLTQSLVGQATRVSQCSIQKQDPFPARIALNSSREFSWETLRATCHGNPTGIPALLFSRCFSTSPRQATESAVEQTTRRIYEIPVGTLTKDKWKEGLEALRNHWTSFPKTDCVEESFNLLERLVVEYEDDKSNNSQGLNTDLLRKLIGNWERWRKDQPIGAKWSPREVLELVETYKIRVVALQADTHIYTSIMGALLHENSGDPRDNLQQIKQVYRFIVKDNKLDPNSKAYETLINAYVQAGNIKEALAIMDKVLEVSTRCTDRHQQQPTLRFDSTIFEEAIRAITDSGDRNAGFLAQMVLDRMYMFDRHGILSRKPGLGHHNAVINAWAKSNHPLAGETTQALMEELPHRNMEPNTTTYNTVIHAWAKKGDVERAEAKLVEMCDKYNWGDDKVKPDQKGFSAVLDAIAKSKAPDAGGRAEKLIRLMWSLHETQQLGVQPNAVAYSSLMKAWASTGHPEAAVHAERVLYEMLQKAETVPDLRPNTILFNIAIHAWSRSGDPEAGKAAMRLVREMDQWTNQYPDLKPDALTITAVVDAYASSGQSDAGVNAEVFLRIYQSSYPTLKLGRITYNAVIRAWAKSGHQKAGFQAEELLREMQSLERDNPDIRHDKLTYSMVIDAWAKSRHSEAGLKAEEILREMQTEAKDDPELKPTTRAYNSVIRAWAEQGDAEQAEALLAELVKSDDKDLQPNHFTFNGVLKAMSRSARLDKGRRADYYLDAMEHFHRQGMPDVKPTELSYKLAHKCWIRSQQDPQAAQRLVDLSASRSS